MKPSSAKSKGRRAQQEVATKLVESAKGKLEPDDIRSTPMGVTGPDVMMSPLAQKHYPFDIEVKNVEKLNIWQAVAQAKGHGDKTPAVCFTKNNEKMFIAIPLDLFLEIYNDYKDIE